MSYKSGTLRIGQSRHPAYGTWRGMKDRCHNANSKQYQYYGGRGIDVCNEWRESSLPFLEWADDNGFKKGLCLDRIDNDKGYSPDNCRWVTHFDNCANRRVKYATNKSGYGGVFWNKGKQKWEARAESKYFYAQKRLSSPKTAAIWRDSCIAAFSLPLQMNFPEVWK